MKESKGKKLPRVVYLPDEALQLARTLANKYPEGPIFRNADGLPWKRYAINCAFIRLQKKLGRKLHLGAFRKSWATEAMKNGVDPHHRRPPAGPFQSIHACQSLCEDGARPGLHERAGEEGDRQVSPPDMLPDPRMETPRSQAGGAVAYLTRVLFDKSRATPQGSGQRAGSHILGIDFGGVNQMPCVIPHKVPFVFIIFARLLLDDGPL